MLQVLKEMVPNIADTFTASVEEKHLFLLLYMYKLSLSVRIHFPLCPPSKDPFYM